MSPALAGGFLTTAPAGKFLLGVFSIHLHYPSHFLTFAFPNLLSHPLSAPSQPAHHALDLVIIHNLKSKDPTLHPCAPILPCSLPLYTELNDPSSSLQPSVY